MPKKLEAKGIDAVAHRVLGRALSIAQIDLFGVPWLMIGEEPSSAPNGGSACVLPEPIRHSA